MDLVDDAAKDFLGFTYILGSDYTLNAVVETTKIPVNSVGDKVYKLEQSAGMDDFGRPGFRTWKYKNKTIASTFADEPVLKYTVAVTKAKLFADLKLTENLTIDGKNAAVYYEDGKFNKSALEILYNAPANDRIGGNGTLTEVYDTDDGYVIVVIHTYFGTIGTVTAATAVASASVNVKPGNNKLDGFTQADGKFTTTGFARNAEVLYTVAQTAKTEYKVKSVEDPDVIKLTPTLISTSSFVAGGKTYNYSEKHEGRLPNASASFIEQNIFFDKHGYVIKTDAVDVDPNYAIVLAYVPDTDIWSVLTHRVELLMMDGSTKKVVASAAATVDKLVTWTINRDDKYVLVEVEDDPEEPATVTSITNGDLDIANGRSRFIWPASVNNFANSSTIYLVAKDPGPGYNAYTGFSRVPKITGTTVTGLVYTVDGFAKIVWIKSGHLAETGTSDAVVFTTNLFDETGEWVDNEWKTYFISTAVANGAIVEEMVFDKDYSKEAGGGPAVWKSRGETAEKYVTLSEKDTATTDDIDGIGKLSSGTIMISGKSYAVASNCAVYEYNNKTGAIEKIELGDIEADEDAVGLFTINNTTAEVVTAIYLDVTPPGS